MKKKLLLIAVVATLLTGCGSKIPKLSNGEEALIEFGDGTTYSVNEVWEEMKESYALQVALTKIDQKILEEEYKDDEKETEEYIKGEETTLKKNFTDDSGKYDESKLLGQLSQAGYSTLQDYLDYIKVSYLSEKAAVDYAKTKITDKQVKEYYKNETVGDIHVLHILVEPASTSSEDDTKAKEEAQKIIKSIEDDIKSGTSIEEAFKKYDKNDNVTFQDLGYINKGEMVESFETTVFALNKGEYTKEPIKTTYGYHAAVKIDEKEKPELKDVEESIKETLAEDALDEDKTLSVNAMIELRKKHKITWHDSELENAYNKYMNYLVNQSKSSN